MIKVITDIKSLGALQEEWHKVYASSEDATPFQSFGYVMASLDVSVKQGCQLYVIIVRVDRTEELIAIFPFVRDKSENLVFANTANTDFCGPIVNRDYDNFNLYKELGIYLRDNSEVKGIKLSNLNKFNPILSSLKPYFQYYFVYDSSYYSTIPIVPMSGDSNPIDSLHYLPRKCRQNRSHRKMRREFMEKGTFKVLSAECNDLFPSSEIIKLIDSMIHSGIRTKEYFSDDMISFWKNLYDSKVMQIGLLYEAGVVKAALLLFNDKRKNEYITWIVLYEDKNYNLLINIMLVDYIYNQGGGSINFARGIYDYKLTNFHPDVKPLFCVKISKTRWGHFRNILSTVFHFAKPIIKSFIRR